MKQGFDDGLFSEGSGTLADVDLDSERAVDVDVEDDDVEDDELDDPWDDDPLNDDPLRDDPLRDDDHRVS